MPKLMIRWSTRLFPFLFILAIPTHTLQAQEGMSVEDLMRMKRVISVSMDGDGSHVAYQSTIPADPRKEKAHTKKQLFVHDVEGDESRSYLKDERFSNVRFRPGKESITFLGEGKDKGTSGLYEMPLDGGGPTLIHSFGRQVLSYEWASDGEKLAFRSKEASSGNGEALPHQPDLYEEGLQYARAFVMDLETPDEEAQQLQVEGDVHTMRWSPEDDRIALSVAPTPRVDDSYMKKTVYVLDAGSGEQKTHIEQKGKLDDVRWSPDGERIAMLGGADMNDVIAGRILTVDADGGEIENIDPDFKGKYEGIRWTADDRIHFIASVGTESAYGSIAVDGSDRSYEHGPGNRIYSAFSQADGQNAAFIINRSDHPGEFHLRTNGKDPERISNSNPWMEDVEFGKQRTVRYEARDGKEIEGVLIEPVGGGKGPHPTIVAVHGGPEAHFSNGWVTYYSRPGQAASAKGYAVFYPNYRGSTGRGEKFLKSSQSDAGGKEFDDVVDGVKYLVDEGIADEEKVGVTGGSYGGYAAGWMATRYSEHFAASVMNFGVSNNISKWGTSDIPLELYHVHAREYIWDDNWMKYLKRSPIYHVDKAQTPLLITHGKEDTRVHPAQSMELFRHMKVRKPEVPLRWVRYPGEGHGYRKPAFQYDYALRMYRWFDHFLKEDNDEKPQGNIDEEIPEDWEWEE